MTSQPTSIDDFMAAVWKDGEVVIDEEEVFKKALGGQVYKNRWLLAPSVIRRIFATAGFGTKTDDLNEKSKMLGGAMIVNKQGVLFAEAETSGFTYPSADTLLAALTKPPEAQCTPSTTDATQ